LIDSAKYNAAEFVRLNVYGLKKFILNEEAFIKPSDLIYINKKSAPFADLKFALKINTKKKGNMDEIRSRIMLSNRVIKAI
jgi:hypothetical protein